MNALIQKIESLALEADEANFPTLTLSLLAVCRIANLPSHVQRRWVNSQALFIEILEDMVK